MPATRYCKTIAAATALGIIVATSVVGQSDPSLPPPDNGAPLGLPRLSRNASDENHRLLKREDYQVLDLSSPAYEVEGSAMFRTKGGKPYLEISAYKRWQAAPRSPVRGRTFVSFTLNVPLNAEISVAGALLRVRESRSDVAYAGLDYGTPQDDGIKWMPLEHEVPLVPFSGRLLASLDVITIKVDHTSGTFALWSRDTLIVADAPVELKRRLDGFEVTTLGDVAWLCGLVFSDENPVYQDDNDNCIPDSFELAQMGGLFDPHSKREELADARNAWLKWRQSQPPSQYVITTPLPDSFPDLCSPNGAVLHGMPDAIRYRVDNH